MSQCEPDGVAVHWVAIGIAAVLACLVAASVLPGDQAKVFGLAFKRMVVFSFVMSTMGNVLISLAGRYYGHRTETRTDMKLFATGLAFLPFVFFMLGKFNDWYDPLFYIPGIG